MENQEKIPVTREALLARLVEIDALLEAKKVGASAMQAEGIDIGGDDPDRADLEAERDEINRQIGQLDSERQDMREVDVRQMEFDGI